MRRADEPPSILTRRSWPLLAVVGYVAALTVWADGGLAPRSWVLGAMAMAVVSLAARRHVGSQRALGAGLAVVLASAGNVDPHAGVDACGGLGALACALIATVSVARIPWDGGIVRPPRRPERPWVVACVLAWGAAIAGPMTLGGSVAGGGAAAAASGAVIAALATMALLAAQTEWALRRRRLELGVASRALALRLLLSAGGVLVALTAATGTPARGGLARLLVAVTCVLVALAARAADAVRVEALARRGGALGVVGGSVALLGAAAAQGRGWDAWGATALTGLIALAIGAMGPWIDAPLRPAGGRWLDAAARASAAVGRADAEDALRGALLALREPGGPSSSSPELWTLTPTRVLTVDAAGYVCERDGELPEALLLVAAGEPEASLRPEVLDALEVRRPELRPLARWMQDRGAMLATLVAGDGEAEAMLVLPRCARDVPLMLEEIRAIKEMADRLGGACRYRAMQARLLARANEQTREAERAEEKIALLEGERALDVGRHALATTRLARPATVGIYAAPSRLALEALERRTAMGAPIALIAPSGVDPVPYLARAHLAGARRDFPLVLVDATSGREHDLAPWSDPVASPLALADRGMLVLLDGAALPLAVQQLVARALAERRTPWERPQPLDVQLALTGVAAVGELVARGRLDPALAQRLADAGPAGVELPRLRDRFEDLRAIVTDRLASEGLRALGRPVGIEHAAFARLVEYPFPGEDAELAALVQRLVARCSGFVVRAADVDAVGPLGVVDASLPGSEPSATTGAVQPRRPAGQTG